MIDRDVAGNGKQPGLDLALARVEAINSPQRALERGRRQIVGGIRVRTAIAEIAKDGWIIKLESLIQRNTLNGHYFREYLQSILR